MKNYCLTLLLLVLVHISLPAQDLNKFAKRQKEINTRGMYSLGAWASANILVNSGLLISDNGSMEDKRFYQFNIAWSAVNLTLATFSLINENKNPTDPEIKSLFKKQRNLEKVFLFNTALDVAYVMTGVWLIERGNNPERDQDTLRGFGKGLILQGSYLFAFDLVMYLIHNRHGKELDPLLTGLSIGPNSLGYRLRF